MVSKLGCSLITSHTQIGPKIVSKRKKILTSAAVINLGAIVTSTNGIATHIKRTLMALYKYLFQLTQSFQQKITQILQLKAFPPQLKEQDFYL